MTELLAIPETVTQAFAAAIVFRRALHVTVVGVVDEMERHVIAQSQVHDDAIWTIAQDRILAVLDASQIPVSRIVLVSNGRFEDTEALAAAIAKSVACDIMKPAKEDRPEQRPLLYSRFNRRVARVGIPAGEALARETIRNLEGSDALLPFALAAEEMDRRLGKQRKGLRLPAPTPLDPDADRLASLEATIAELRSLVASQQRTIEALTSREVAA